MLYGLIFVGFHSIIVFNPGLFSSGLYLITALISPNGVLKSNAFLFTGFGFGGVPTVASTTINKMYGKKYYSANFSVYMLTCIPAAFLGPALSGVLVTASGSYFTTFCMMLAASIIGTGIALTIKKP